MGCSSSTEKSTTVERRRQQMRERSLSVLAELRTTSSTTGTSRGETMSDFQDVAPSTVMHNNSKQHPNHQHQHQHHLPAPPTSKSDCKPSAEYDFEGLVSRSEMQFADGQNYANHSNNTSAINANEMNQTTRHQNPFLPPPPPPRQQKDTSATTNEPLTPRHADEIDNMFFNPTAVESTSNASNISEWSQGIIMPPRQGELAKGASGYPSCAGEHCINNAALQVLGGDSSVTPSNASSVASLCSQPAVPLLTNLFTEIKEERNPNKKRPMPRNSSQQTFQDSTNSHATTFATESSCNESQVDDALLHTANASPTTVPLHRGKGSFLSSDSTFTSQDAHHAHSDGPAMCNMQNLLHQNR